MSTHSASRGWCVSLAVVQRVPMMLNWSDLIRFQDHVFVRIIFVMLSESYASYFTTHDSNVSRIHVEFQA